MCAYTWAYSRVFYVPWYVYKYTVCRRIQDNADALYREDRSHRRRLRRLRQQGDTVIRYSAVCAFNNDLNAVVLIHKLKPTWQIDRANFPGGKVEASDGEGERGHRLCAIRELQEETGLVVDAVDLTLFCVLRFDGDVCYFYACKTDIHKAHTKETETVFLGYVSEVLTGAVGYFPGYGPSVTLRTMSNLPFLMSMALACVKGIFTRIKHFDVTEVYSE